MSELAQLLVPAVRWDPVSGFANSMQAVDRALALGVGGFILFGGSSEAVLALTRHMAATARGPLLVMSDLERGAGQQVVGATGLPPLGAVGAVNELALTRAAAQLTAREAAALGIRSVLAPVADVDLSPDNPIVGTRAFGSSPDHVAAHVGAWIEACQREGAMACAKHFPGHGRTVRDSHAELPVVEGSEAELMATDLLPFRTAIGADVAAIMTAHVAYPALDHTRAPATLSRRIMRDLLRDRLGFRGLVVTDAMIMSGVLSDGDEASAACRALDAGCDLLLYPQDVDRVIGSLESGVRSRTLSIRALERSLERRFTWAEWCARQPAPAAVTDDLHVAAQALCDASIRVVRGRVQLQRRIDLVIVDDDVGGPYPAPSRAPLFETLAAHGLDAQVIHQATPRVPIAPGAGDTSAALPELRTRLRPGASLLVVAFNDIRAWKGMPGFSAGAKQLMAHVVDEGSAVGREATVVSFTHPRLADSLTARAVVTAWGGESPMQRAVGAWLGAAASQ